MQAYFLITDGTNCLIPKKAIATDLWGGERSKFGPVLVNQPGQYALFGGKVEAGEDPKQAGLREFQEESGVSLDGTDVSSMHKIAEKAGQYECYALVVAPETLQSLREKSSSNIANGNVKDGEMGSVEMVPLGEVKNHLGVDQKPVLTFEQRQQYAKGENKRPGRHSINWYQEIAAETDRKCAAIASFAIADRRGASPPVDEVLHSHYSEYNALDVASVRSSSVSTVPHLIESDSEHQSDPREEVMLHVKRCLQDQITPYRGDIQTKDAMIEVMADVIVSGLSKDEDLIQQVSSNPEIIHKAVKGIIPSAKVERFLEKHYQDDAHNIEHAFRNEHKFERSGKNIAEYVATEVRGNFALFLKEKNGHAAVDSMVEALVERGSNCGTSSAVYAKQPKRLIRGRE